MAEGMTGIADLAPGERVILISRVVNAPRDLMFEAFTNPEHLTKFWGPKGFDCTDCKVDLRVGGSVDRRRVRACIGRVGCVTRATCVACRSVLTLKNGPWAALVAYTVFNFGMLSMRGGAHYNYYHHY